MQMEAKKKKCFVIAPIGKDGSDTRIRSDKILKHIIEPVVLSLDYEKPVRADKISAPGSITSQIIEHVVNDDLVIADLTDHNANVFYELALRHAIKKPVVQIIKAGQQLPFDVITQRTIEVDHTDIDSYKKCLEELPRQIKAAEKDSDKVDNPISIALDLSSLRNSGKSSDEALYELFTQFEYLSRQISDVTSSVNDLHYTVERLADDSPLGAIGIQPSRARLSAGHIYTTGITLPPTEPAIPPAIPPAKPAVPPAEPAVPPAEPAVPPVKEDINKGSG